MATLFDTRLSDNFWKAVLPNPNNGCWLWRGRLDDEGYGYFYPRTRVLAHRFAYTNLVGEIPLGFHVDHLCRVRHCVNPDHLEPVTAQENQRRGLLGILRTHCRNGHAMTDINTRIRKTDTGSSRVCRKCDSIRQLACKARRVARAA